MVFRLLGNELDTILSLAQIFLPKLVDRSVTHAYTELPISYGHALGYSEIVA
jgi:hypothetical protein